MKAIDDLDRRSAWAFHPWFFVIVALIVGISLGLLRWRTGLPVSTSATLATFGAFMACCGVITIGRPMIRAGGYRAWFEKSRIIDEGHIVPTPEEIEEAKQGEKDAAALQITGPALVIVGTMLNGLSGFF
ncbi:hypothetical protein [Bradyrhizobium sp. WD16]|uniref:hypothetical protein n=1 Tax=Bradyrhizobium sp. WD16 TaxID=1521768 RepID=UPI0020A39FEE|nr:hypothetical protein [Bradyrhizobium sp. WD16]UTD26126.1 hypothetical protein DB459_03490 [Bradyrhizobium sp. WD16]